MLRRRVASTRTLPDERARVFVNQRAIQLPIRPTNAVNPPCESALVSEFSVDKVCARNCSLAPTQANIRNGGHIKTCATRARITFGIGSFDEPQKVLSNIRAMSHAFQTVLPITAEMRAKLDHRCRRLPFLLTGAPSTSGSQ